ncbi:MAG TPA: putative baseplate assembly protein [Thermoanaerobaculia bacterium]|jgi:hypothetical protein|nr:putative baseplate assembly protein [Thermoanaerobaculia bacterium]
MVRLNRCGCCDSGAPATPEQVWNRPGLSAIRYRAGTFVTFRRALLSGLADRPELREWTTRASDDYGIALLSMWAYIGDILTFYNERIANEAYLGTAVLRESAMRLAALLDYQPDPGVAATAWLSFNAEKDKEVRIPLGLRVQSVPGQDEKPQKFETVQPVQAQARLNRVRAFPQPLAATPLAQNAAEALLAPGDVPDLAPGEKLVVRLANTVEEKQVEALEPRDGWTFLKWSPAVQGNDGQSLYKWTRKMRLFGHNAPATFLKPQPVAEPSTQINWTTTNTDFNLGAVSALNLDAVYDLKRGSWLLIAGFDFAQVRRVAAVTQSGEILGLLSGTVSHVTLEGGVLPAIADLRQVTVYELAEMRQGNPPVPLWNRRFADTVTGSTIYLPLDQVQGVDAGRALILDDAQGQPQVVVTTAPATAADTDGDGVADHLAVPFTPPITRPLDTWSAFILGNIALSTHGEKVVNEVLGSGDASRTFQSFKLKKAPVTHVPDPKAPHGAASTLEVRVDGIRWHEVRSLFGSGPDDRVYVTRVTRIGEDDVMTVQFGDGETGARLTTGRNNVTANYRHGLGLAGRVRAHTLIIPLDRPVGLKGSNNPAAAEGGAEAEPLEAIRDNAPNTVRTFDRVISLRDFEDAAREFAGVAKARAAWKWDAEERVVQLTVAGDGDAPLGPTALADLKGYLDARRDPHRRMKLESYAKVFVEIEMRIEPDPDHDAEKVQQAVIQALEDFFAFDKVDLGQPVQLSDVYSVVQGVEGVIAADLDRLMFKPPRTIADLLKRAVRFTLGVPDAVQPRLLLFSNELARIETPSTDLIVHLGINP